MVKVSFDTESGGGGGNERSPLLGNGSQQQEQEQQNHPQRKGFTAGYTDYMHTPKALKVFFFHSFCYYAVAVVLFHFVFNQGWTIIDSLYFATVLFTTIGYGDLAPTTDIGRICTMCLSLYGIVILGIFLGVYGEALVENQKSGDSDRKAAMRCAARETVNRMAASRRNLIPEGDDDEEEETTTTAQQPPDPLATIQEEKKETPSDNAPQCRRKMFTKDAPPPLPPPVVEEAHALKKVKRALMEDICLFLLDVLPIMIAMLAVGVLLGYFEGWDVIKSVYWVIISGTTIGLGDEAPQNQFVRLTCVFFLPSCVAVMGQFLSKVAGIYIGRKRRKQQEEFFSRALTMTDLETMDTDCDGEVDKGEFLAYMLVALQMVDPEEINEINRLFDALDVDKSGSLQQQDLHNMNMHESIQQAVISTVLEVDVDEDSLHELKESVSHDPKSTRNLVKSYASKWTSKVKQRKSRNQTSSPTPKLVDMLPILLARAKEKRARDGAASPSIKSNKTTRASPCIKSNKTTRASTTTNPTLADTV